MFKETQEEIIIPRFWREKAQTLAGRLFPRGLHPALSRGTLRSPKVHLSLSLRWPSSALMDGAGATL